jgi:hypothetical protein
LIAASVGACWGCGDGDGDGGSGSSGVSGSLLLEELSDEQAQSLCRFYEQQYKASLGTEEQYCTFDAVWDPGSVEQCESYKAECFEYGDYGSDKQEDWECENSTLSDFVVDDVEGPCTATVAEFEACIKTQMEADRAFGAQASCQDESTYGQPETTEACLDLYEKCPNVEL